MSSRLGRGANAGRAVIGGKSVVSRRDAEKVDFAGDDSIDAIFATSTRPV
jgi:hypothetical protein